MRFIRYEIPKSMLAIFDQGVMSLTNFVLNLVLARYASPEVYGRFIIVFSVFLFVTSFIHTPLTLDPLIILGNKIDNKENQFIYVRRTLGFHLLLSLISIVVLVIIAIFFCFFKKPVYAEIILLTFAPLFFINLRLFIRCFYIMKGEFKKAFKNDLRVLIIVILGAIGLVHLGEISDWEVVALMTISEVVVILFFIILNYKKFFHFISSFLSDIKAQHMFWKWKEIQQNWNYGKWLMLANVGNYVYQNAQFLLLPVFVSLAELARYRAWYLLTQPIYMFTTGLEAYVWNQSVERMKNGGIKELWNFLWKMARTISLFILLYGLFIAINSHTVVKVVYAGKFDGSTNLLWFFILAALFNFWGKLSGSGLRALESTAVISSSILYAGTTGLVTFLILTKSLGIMGTAISYALSSLITVLIMILKIKSVIIER